MWAEACQEVQCSCTVLLACWLACCLFACFFAGWLARVLFRLLADTHCCATMLAGAQPSSDAPTTKTPAAPGGQSTAAGQSSASSSNSSSVHTAKQQLPRLLPPLQPATHSSGSSSGAALSASQRLMHEAMRVQAASLDCHSSTATACCRLSEHEAQCTMPSHVVPMLASLVSQPHAQQHSSPTSELQQCALLSAVCVCRDAAAAACPPGVLIFIVGRS